jgi:hypothetical protein
MLCIKLDYLEEFISFYHIEFCLGHQDMFSPANIEDSSHHLPIRQGEVSFPCNIINV